MAPTDLPDPAPDIADAWLLGAWYILFTNHGFWQRRTHPRVEYTALEGDGSRPRMLDALRFRQVDMLGREQRKLLLGVDVVERPGQYAFDESLTLSGILEQAGAQRGARRVVLRRGGVEQEVDLSDVKSGRAPDIALQPGDEIVVKARRL